MEWEEWEERGSLRSEYPGQIDRMKPIHGEDREESEGEWMG